MLKCVLAAGMLASAVGNAQAGTWPPKWWGGASASMQVGGEVTASAQEAAPNKFFSNSSNTPQWGISGNVATEISARCAYDSNHVAIGASSFSAWCGATVTAPIDTTGLGLSASAFVGASAGGAAGAYGVESTQKCLSVYPTASARGGALATITLNLLKPVVLITSNWSGSLTNQSGTGTPAGLVRAVLSGPTSELIREEIGMPSASEFQAFLPAHDEQFRLAPGTVTLLIHAGTAMSAAASMHANDGESASTGGMFGIGVSPILCPESTTIPMSQQFSVEGGSTQFSCSVRFHNMQFVHYRWYQNGSMLTDSSDGVSVIGSDTSALYLGGVMHEDVGTYTCVVTSSDGCPPLTVLGGTISFVDPECTEVAEVVAVSSPRVSTCVGREMRFEVGVARMEDMHFLHDGQVLSDGVLASGAVVSGAGTNVLTISNVTTSESGSYGVVAQGACGPIVGAELFDASVASSCCPADFTGDAMVDDADFVLFVGAYNLLDCADPEMGDGCPCDLTGDAMVEDSDFVVFVGAYNELVCE